MSGEPFPFPVQVVRIPPGGKHFRVEANEEQRKNVAANLGIVDVASLDAELDVRPAGADAFSVKGALRATVVQTDVVTLDPVEQEIQEVIDLILTPADADSRSKQTTEGEHLADVRDVYRGNQIHLGAIVVEHLALGLDPYPRSPGVEFPGHTEGDPSDSSPFSALAKLKRDQE